MKFIVVPDFWPRKPVREPNYLDDERCMEVKIIDMD